MKIHKLGFQYVDVRLPKHKKKTTKMRIPYILCGRKFSIEKNYVLQWKKVTCKNCLKKGK